MLLTILVFVIMLNILVFVHELGHFLVALKLGIKVEEFGFGLPPRIWGKQFRGVLLSINALPIGGFVRLLGEDAVEGKESLVIGKKTGGDWSKYFFARPKWQRAAVLLAGVTMNFVLAVAIISYIFSQGIYVPSDTLKITNVLENSPAAAVGLKDNDVIVSANGKAMKTSEDLIKLINETKDQPTRLQILRDGQQTEYTVSAKEEIDQGTNQKKWRIGIELSNLEFKKYTWYQAPFFGLIEAFKLSYQMLSALGSMLFKLITFQQTSVDVAGPVGIAQATGKAIDYGFMAVLQLMGLLSLNLAIFNLLPIPALDGGRLFFVLFEKWLGKHVQPKAEAMVHQVGMMFLLGLIVLVTINDVIRLIQGKSGF